MMRCSTAAALLFCLPAALCLSPRNLHAQDSVASTADLAELRAAATEQAVNRVQGAVVQVRLIGEFQTLSREASSTTTGLLIDDTWVLTSSFGMQNRPTTAVIVFRDGTTTSAAIVSIDHGRRTALLKLSEPNDRTSAPIEPRTAPVPGRTTIAVGAAYSPASLNLSVGALSAASRMHGRAVQTDAAVSPANYGGPLIDLHGRVLGLLTPIGTGASGSVEWYDSGIGFAIPLPDIFDRLPKMKQGKDLYPGRAGIALAEGNPFVTKPIVAKLSTNGPAMKAGVRKKDTIIAVNDAPVATHKQFQIALGPHDAGDTVQLKLKRGDSDLTVKLTLASAKDLKRKEVIPALLERMKLKFPQPK